MKLMLKQGKLIIAISALISVGIVRAQELGTTVEITRHAASIENNYSDFRLSLLASVNNPNYVREDCEIAKLNDFVWIYTVNNSKNYKWLADLVNSDSLTAQQKDLARALAELFSAQEKGVKAIFQVCDEDSTNLEEVKSSISLISDALKDIESAQKFIDSSVTAAD